MDLRQERIYSNGLYSVIKRTNEYGIYYSTVRWGSVFFEETYLSLTRAIEWCDSKRSDQHENDLRRTAYDRQECTDG